MTTLRLRDDLRATEVEVAGLKYFDVADPRSGATLRMYEHEWLLARRLNGASSYEEVAGWAAGGGSQLGFRPSAQDVAGYAGRLAELGFFDEPESVARLPVRAASGTSMRDETSFADLNAGRLPAPVLDIPVETAPRHGGSEHTTVPGAPIPAVLAELRAAQAAAESPPPAPQPVRTAPPPIAASPAAPAAVRPPAPATPPRPAASTPAVAADKKAAAPRGGLLGALVLILLLVVLAAVYFLVITPTFAPVHVRAQTVAPAHDVVRYSETRGNVHLSAPVVLSFGDAGKIVDVVAVGTPVTAGKLLATLDTYAELQKGLADVRDRETFYETALKAAVAKKQAGAAKVAQAKVDEKKALRQQIEEKLAKVRIVATGSGTVSEVVAGVGASVTAAAPVIRVVDRRLLADVKIAPADTALVTAGASLTATTADHKQTTNARVLSVEAGVAHLQLDDAATGFQDSSEIVLVKVKLPHVTTLPAAALVKSQGGTDQVFLIAGDIVRTRPVTVVERSAAEVLVAGDSLAPSERVVIAPPPTLQDGQKATTAP